MNKELMESMNILEKEYNISKDTLTSPAAAGWCCNAHG